MICEVECSLRACFPSLGNIASDVDMSWLLSDGLPPLLRTRRLTRRNQGSDRAGVNIKIAICDFNTSLRFPVAIFQR